MSDRQSDGRMSMSVDSRLKARLKELASRRAALQLWCKLAACWTAAAFLGLGWLALEGQRGWNSALALPVIALFAIAVAAAIVLLHAGTEPDWHGLAQQIETRYPELDGRLLTAVQQRAEAGAELNYLQERLLQEALLHSQKRDWIQMVPGSRLAIAGVAHVLALVLFGIVLLTARTPASHGFFSRMVKSGITVTPGDISLERGNTLVVLARFGGALPAAVELVVGPSADATRRIPLVKSLADPMFGGSVPEVSSNLVYHIEYAGQRTRDFKVTVFEHPRLERADAAMTFPDYTGERPKRIEDTRRLSAVEGSRVQLTLQLNKPVASARLVARDKERTAIPLSVETNRAVATLKRLPLEA